MIIVGTVEVLTSTNSSGNATIDISSVNIKAGDVIYALVWFRNNSGTLGITGFTGLATQTNLSPGRSRGFAKEAAGGEQTIAVTTSSGAFTLRVQVVVLRGLDVSSGLSTAVDVAYTTTNSAATSVTSPLQSTSYDNQLVLFSVVADTAVPIMDFDQSMLLLSMTGLATAYGWQQTAGNTDQPVWRLTASAATAVWVVSFRASSEKQPYATDARTFLVRPGYDTFTTSAPNSVLASISGVTCSGTAITPTLGIPSGGGWIYSGLMITSTETSLVSGCWIDVTLDLDAKTITIPIGLGSTVDASRFGADGVLLGFADGSGNYVIYQLLPQRKFDVSLATYIVLKCGVSQEFLNNDTNPLNTLIDWTAITKVGFLFPKNTSATDVSAMWGFSTVEDSPIVLVGGSENSPITPAFCDFAIRRNGIFIGASSTQGEQQLVNRGSVTLGDGSTDSYIDFTGSSYEWPLTPSDKWVPGTNSANLTVNVSAGSTVDFGSGITRSSSEQTLTIASTSSLSATYLTNGRSFIGINVIDDAGIDWVGAIFDSCYTLQFAGGDLTNCTVVNPQSTAGMVINASGATLNGCEIDVTGTSATHHLYLDSTVNTVTLADHTFTGTAATNKVHVLKTTGTVTITISGTTSLVAGDVTSEGATVVIAAPELYQSVTIGGLTSGSRVQIYDTTAATELANSTQASPGSNVTWASATAMTWTDPVAAATDRTIRVRIAYVSGTSAKGFIEASIGTCGTTDGTEAVSYLANQVDDAVYNANGIDGPSIYATSGITFTDSGSNDRINCNIGGGAVSWGTIYACFAYWMSTSTGIADDIAYVTAVDTANYLLDSLKIKNTSATPLTITGGWGRDATSLTIADCIDTAGSTGNIFPQPDHVVAYATGSGSLTAGDITNIWSNGSRTLTTTIPSASDNATAVAAVAVDGDVTLAESMRLQNAMLAGKVSGAGTGTEVFRSLADDKDRATVTVDSSGNRSDVVRDLT